MIWQIFFPGLLDTGPAFGEVRVIRDGMVNFFVLKGGKGLVCIDSGWRPGWIASSFKGLGLDPGEVVAVFLTHLHWDHACGLKAFSNAQVFAGEGDPPQLFTRSLLLSREVIRVRDGQDVERAGVSLRVVGTPGHTPGSVSYLVEGRLLFTGDTIRLRHGEAVPFMAWAGCDRRAQIGSIRKLAGLAQVECVLTGHSGFSADVAKAFRHWRDAANGTQRECAP